MKPSRDYAVKNEGSLVREQRQEEVEETLDFLLRNIGLPPERQKKIYGLNKEVLGEIRNYLKNLDD